MAVLNHRQRKSSFLITGSKDGSILIWRHYQSDKDRSPLFEVERRLETKPFRHNKLVSDIAVYSPSHKTLKEYLFVSVGHDNMIIIWNFDKIIDGKDGMVRHTIGEENQDSVSSFSDEPTKCSNRNGSPFV